MVQTSFRVSLEGRSVEDGEYYESPCEAQLYQRGSKILRGELELRWGRKVVREIFPLQLESQIRPSVRGQVRLTGQGRQNHFRTVYLLKSG